eukprot:TRINITY_DN4403_c0_g1_i3.p2 TRINITY_DN4403_c0_g1~~TRINITY_DN4403_c0_g1_i3.p2  ORF type:complete len:139 (-),score=28.82 TRINITY_DN4403_c0_g1_i3:203-619(-)
MIKALLNGTPRYSHPVQPHKCLDVRLNSVVKTVTQGAHGCAVQLEDGSELQCDVVVLSVPLGVLKASIQQQHTPQGACTPNVLHLPLFCTAAANSSDCYSPFAVSAPAAVLRLCPLWCRRPWGDWLRPTTLTPQETRN